MSTQRQTSEARRVANRLHRGLGEDVRRLREDAALSRAQLAAAVGMDPSYLARIEDGLAHASVVMYGAIALALGADLSTRLYPNTGPTIRDRHQGRILEALLQMLHPRWKAYPEVAVRRSSRGWIDAGLHARLDELFVASEIQSDMRRVEQLLRWFPEKVASLPSWEGWSSLGPIRDTSQLLIVRSTAATRRVGREFERQLNAAYPAHPADAIDSLVGTRPWPGPALIWAEMEPTRVRFVRRR